MKHVILSKAFEWGTDPFPAFRASLVFGRNKRDREFLPVKDVSPQFMFTVRAPSYEGSPGVLYSGPSKQEAEKAKAAYDAEPRQEAFKEYPEGVRRPAVG